MAKVTARARQKSVEPAPAKTPERELEELRFLMQEQLPQLRDKAARETSKPTVAWMAKGDHLVLLIAERGRKVRRFDCRILELVELPDPEPASDLF